jgi:hypothetical protein
MFLAVIANDLPMEPLLAERDGIVSDLNMQMGAFRDMHREALAADPDWSPRVRSLLQRCIKESREEKRTKRRQTKKAAAIAAAVLGATTVSAFARGEEVVLQGTQIAIGVRHSGSIYRSGHGALQISLLGPEGTRLSSLCMFQEDTPALDQLASIALHIEAGAESDVVGAGNLFATTTSALEHPVIAARLDAPRNHVDIGAMDDLVFSRNGGTRLARDPHQERLLEVAKRDYTAKHIPTYYAALSTFVFGRHQRHPLIQRYLGILQTTA